MRGAQTATSYGPPGYAQPACCRRSTSPARQFRHWWPSDPSVFLGSWRYAASASGRSHFIIRSSLQCVWYRWLAPGGGRTHATGRLFQSVTAVILQRPGPAAEGQAARCHAIEASRRSAHRRCRCATPGGGRTAVDDGVRVATSHVSPAHFFLAFLPRGLRPGASSGVPCIPDCQVVAPIAGFPGPPSRESPAEAIPPSVQAPACLALLQGWPAPAQAESCLTAS